MVTAGSFILLLLRFLLGLGRGSGLRSPDWSFSFFLGEQGGEARRGEQHGGEDKNTHEVFLHQSVTGTNSIIYFCASDRNFRRALLSEIKASGGPASSACCAADSESGTRTGGHPGPCIEPNHVRLWNVR
jgi:hypothetical protein